MKYAIFFATFLISFNASAQQGLFNGQYLDTLRFSDEQNFDIEYTHYSDGYSLKTATYTSKISELKKVDHYNRKHQLIQSEIWSDTLIRHRTFKYFEKGELVKVFDEVNKVSLPSHLNIYLKYPAIAREEGIEGDIVVQFQYDEHCIVVGFKLENSLGYGIDKEVRNKLKRYVALAKKHQVTTLDCQTALDPITFKFRLE
ncbi:MAG: hypothetical protein P1U56_03065 [Saprospiraceae bacterium]|nr:hypothetical protein [Saprospiraceae bacterium]